VDPGKEVRTGMGRAYGENFNADVSQSPSPQVHVHLYEWQIVMLGLCPNVRLQVHNHFYFVSCEELALEDAEDLGKHEGLQAT
jgi:hypothetical protein